MAMAQGLSGRLAAKPRHVFHLPLLYPVVRAACFSTHTGLELQAGSENNDFSGASKASKPSQKKKLTQIGRRVQYRVYEVERRIDLDRRPKTREEFVATHDGYEGELAWEAAANRRFVEIRFSKKDEPRFLHEVQWRHSEADARKIWKSYRHKAYKLTEIMTSQQSVADLLAKHAHLRLGLNGIHLSACWHTLGVLTSKGRWASAEREWLAHNPHEAESLREHTLAMMPLLGARSLCSVGWGAAKAGLSEGPEWTEMFTELETWALAKVRNFGGQSTSKILWAFAKTEHGPRARELFEALAAWTLEGPPRAQLGSFGPQELSNLAWAYATAGHSHPELFDQIAEACVPLVDSFTPQGLSVTASSFAKNAHATRSVLRLYHLLADAAEQRLGDFQPQAIANTAYALAKAGQKSPSLFEAISHTARRKLRLYTSQEIALLAFGFGEVGHDCAELFEAIIEEIRWRGTGAFMHPATRTMILRSFERVDRSLPEDIHMVMPEVDPAKRRGWEPHVPVFD